MALIWLFLFGWARIVSGHFTPPEIAMTVVVGAACLCGIGVSLGWRTDVPRLTAWVVGVVFGVLQLLAFRLSLLPSIATQ
jgi:hypothetical protein